jgi:hypothetical protein
MEVVEKGPGAGKPRPPASEPPVEKKPMSILEKYLQRDRKRAEEKKERDRKAKERMKAAEIDVV